MSRDHRQPSNADNLIFKHFKQNPSCQRRTDTVLYPRLWSTGWADIARDRELAHWGAIRPTRDVTIHVVTWARCLAAALIMPKREDLSIYEREPEYISVPELSHNYLAWLWLANLRCRYLILCDPWPVIHLRKAPYDRSKNWSNLSSLKQDENRDQALVKQPPWYYTRCDRMG